MGNRYNRRPMTNEEIVEGYELSGETATDALRDARSFGYQNQYSRGFAHGAICAGIGCLIGGAVDLLMAKRDSDKNIERTSRRLVNSRLMMESDRRMEEIKREESREDNND